MFTGLSFLSRLYFTWSQMTHTRTIFCTKPVSIILHFNVTLTTEIRKFWISFSKETKHIRQNLNDITLRCDFVTKFRHNGWNEIYHFRWFDFSTYGSFHHRLIDTSSTSLLFYACLKNNPKLFFEKRIFVSVWFRPVPVSNESLLLCPWCIYKWRVLK